MALTLGNLKSIAQHALGGGNPATVITSADATLQQYINEAGRFLFSMRNWNWAVRPPADLDFTSGQAYVALPSDFGELIAYAGQNNIARPLRITTPQEILTLRKSFLVTTWTYFAAIVQPDQTSHATPPARRLELYPTPASSTTAAITIVYRAQWIELTDNSWVPNVPLRFETLLAECVREYVRGMENYEGKGLQERLAAITGGPMAQALIRYDADESMDIGPPENGALLSARSGYPSPQQFQPAVVTGP